MGIVALVLYIAARIYIFVLIGRVVFDMVMVFARDWRPTGLLLVIANLIYRLTDPPLRFLGRYIPPLQLGGIALDMGFLVLFFGISFLSSFLPRFF